MKINYIHLLLVCLMMASIVNARKSKTWEVKSPDGRIIVSVTAGTKLQWSVQHQNQPIILPSPISLQLADDKVLGDNAQFRSSTIKEVKTEFKAINYKKAAQYKLLIDYHGIFKPTGLQRTYPNVVGYEGVKGMENVKWAHEDVPRYDVTIPYIRMLAGPMDYTPGAMRNANKMNFRPINSDPMSQGTRCHQLAMYVIFEVPLQMLADNPTIYMQEQESTDFITQIPTTFDETVALDGKVGEYVVLARRKSDTWYVGAMCNWDARELTLDFSFLNPGIYNAIVFKDGINADREATDYKREELKISGSDTLKIQLATGGGWAARIKKIAN